MEMRNINFQDLKESIKEGLDELKKELNCSIWYIFFLLFMIWKNRNKKLIIIIFF